MTRSPLSELAAPLAQAIADVGGDGAPVRLERPADADHGDYASAVALGLARSLRAAPREIAGRIGERVQSPWIASVEIAGPGFINLRVAPSFHRHVVQRVLDEGDSYGSGAAAHPQRIQVEYVSGNPTGPVTASTARNAAYGDSLARLFAFAGNEVQREYYFNDAGRQMDLFGASLWARAHGEPVPEGGYQGAYLEEIVEQLQLPEDAIPDDWRQRGGQFMTEDIKRTLERFRASFDCWFLERSLYEDGSLERAIERVKGAGHTFEKDGALWLRSTEFGDDKDRVIVRSNGSPTYIAGDLAYIESKLERVDVAVYVLGSDHHGYIGRLKAGAQALGYDPDRVDVQIYQLVKIIEGGQAVKVSKRRGNVLMLDELLDMIGVDAARYALVQRSHDQVIELDLDRWVEQNDENPVYYCQYAHARIAAILRNAGPAAEGAAPDPEWVPEPPEAELIKALADFPDLVAEASERRGPHRIAGYTQDTAKAFHQFYRQCRVLGSPPAVERSRLALCMAAMQVIRTALDLIGVEAPESM
ncbi:MAG: arginine--tRNA ligase [Gaiellales bacterium]